MQGCKGFGNIPAEGGIIIECYSKIFYRKAYSMIKAKYLIKVISGIMCVLMFTGCSLPAADSSSDVNTREDVEQENDDSDTEGYNG